MTCTRSEFSLTAKLALPIALGLAGHGLMTTLDAGFLGRFSNEALAACGLGTNIHLPPLIFGYGMLAGVSVLAAQGRGSGDMSAPARSLRAGLVTALALGLVVAVGLHAATAAGALRLSGLPEPVLREAGGFLVALAWSTPFSYLFQALKNSAEADNRPWPPLLWLLTGLGVNALAAWGLVFGKFGLPALGATGAGLATLLGRVVMLAGLAWTERDALRAACVPEARGGLRALLAFGIPCGLHWLAEVGVFCAAPMLIGRWFGTASLAAYQIAVSVAGLAFMLPLGLSQAAGIRAGEAFGAADFPRLRGIGRGALGFSLLFMGVYAVGVTALHTEIPAWFTGRSGSAETISLARKMLLVAAVFALADGVQVTASGLLRGLGDTRYAFVVGLVSYWLVGFPTGVVLAFTCGLGALGVWMGLAAGLFLAAALFSLRWRRLSRRSYSSGEL